MSEKEIEYWIQPEQEENYSEVEALVKEAFMGLENGNPMEPVLVKKLRKGDSFVPGLSLIAHDGEKILGHILLTRIRIVGPDKEILSLAMAPVSVLPDMQNQGIGGELIRVSIEMAKAMEYGSIIVLGHPEYYPRFGFQSTEKWQIRASFEVPAEALMGLELEKGALAGSSMGIIEYPAVFFEEK
ncbi:N-acetyltransferase [Gottschalkiaceae bacterium SANA]|nr:N-acetyltransferase [Gottschalkiaceae bacterium SANA]